MDYASNKRTDVYTDRKVYDAAVNGGISTLGTGKTEVSQFKENETKVQSDYLLTYTNSFDNGNHNPTATAGFTTYYNSLSRLDGARKQESDWSFRIIRTNGLSASAMRLPLPMEVLNGNAVHYPYLHA